MAEIVKNPLWEMGAYKTKIRTLLMNDEDVTSLTMPNLENDNFTFKQNWFGGKYNKNKLGATEKVLLVGHCLDTPFVDATMSDVRTVICIETILPSVVGDNLKNMKIQITIVSHHDAMPMDEAEYAKYKAKGYEGNRCDMIMMAINNALISEDTKRKFGIGSIGLAKQNPITTFILTSDYYARTLTYEVCDFYVPGSMR